MAENGYGRVIAVVLAGGKGTRFRPFTEIIPKPMMPIGSSEKPLLEHIVSWLAKHGLKDYVFLVGYKWKQIQNYFRDGSYMGIRIRYSIDDKEYSGTGGALVKAALNGFFDSYDHVLVWYGDIIAEVDVGELLRQHHRTGADATLVLADRYQLPVGVARVNSNGDVVELKEKPWIDIMITIGVLVVEKKAVVEAGRALGKSFDIMGDMIPWMIRRGYRVKAFIHRGPWYDVGSLERYKKFEEELFPNFLS